MTSVNPISVARRVGAAVTALAPIALLVAMVWHPLIPGRLPDNTAVAEAASGGLTRWGLAHFATAVASALIILAFIAVRGVLRDAGDSVLSGEGIAFVVLGSTLFAFLPGMEMSLIAASSTGADLAATQTALQPWFISALMIGGVSFAAGAILFAMALLRTAILDRRLTILVAAGLVVFGLSRVIPLGIVQFYLQPAAALVALLPLAAAMWASGGDQLTKWQT